MSATLSRLILSMTLLIATPMVYALGLWIGFGYGLGDGVSSLVLAMVLSMAVLIAGWLGIWRREVQWTRQRRQATAGIIGTGAGLAAVVAGVCHLVFPFDGVAFGLFVGYVLWALTWLAGTALFWRETTAERTERLKGLGLGIVACPHCGYNLTGLRTAECPECGAKFTLDRLYGEMLHQRRETEQHV